jgi:hypothetical protein
MTARVQPDPTPTSRRALLAGVAGGIGALAASAIGRPDPAAAISYVVLEGDNTSSAATTITNNTTTAAVFAGISTSGTGLWGSSGSGKGIYGFSNSSIGIHGYSNSATGVFGESGTNKGVYGSSVSYIGVYGDCGSGWGVFGSSDATDHPATVGRSNGNSTGVQGLSGGGPLPGAKAKTGVYGRAAQDSKAKGVWGESVTGHGIHGTASTGWAGYFAGRVYTSRYHEMKEISVPAAPGANKARLFVRDNGSGKSQLCVRFNTGGVLVIKTQP